MFNLCMAHVEVVNEEHVITTCGLPKCRPEEYLGNVHIIGVTTPCWHMKCMQSHYEDQNITEPTRSIATYKYCHSYFILS